MEAYDKLKEWLRGDGAVSPVIAVILMVAITVVLAATVYVWVSGFASDTSGPEQASATATGRAVGSGNSSINWVRVSLTNGENAPYNETQVSYTVLDQDGSSYSAKGADGASDNDVLCREAKPDGATPTNCDGVDFHGDSTTDHEWDVGGVLYVPCQGDGEHSITISVKDTTVLDTTVDCETQA